VVKESRGSLNEQKRSLHLPFAGDKGVLQRTAVMESEEEAQR